MATEKITLTQDPIEVGTGELFISSTREFRYAYSDTEPTDLSVSHVAEELYTNGNFGKLWAWSSSQKETPVIVSKGA